MPGWLRIRKGAFRLSGTGLIITAASFITPDGLVGWMLGLFMLVLGLIILCTGLYALVQPCQVRTALEAVLDECEARVRTWLLLIIHGLYGVH